MTKCEDGGGQFFAKIAWRHLWTAPNVKRQIPWLESKPSHFQKWIESFSTLFGSSPSPSHCQKNDSSPSRVIQNCDLSLTRVESCTRVFTSLIYSPLKRCVYVTSWATLYWPKKSDILKLKIDIINLKKICVLFWQIGLNIMKFRSKKSFSVHNWRSFAWFVLEKTSFAAKQTDD